MINQNEKAGQIIQEVSKAIIGKSACIKVKSGLALVIETKNLST